MYQISNSEIENYQDCGRKWWLNYVRGLAPKQQKIVGALPLGSRIHSALEGYYQSWINDGARKDLLEVHSGLVEADRLELMMAGHDSSALDDEAELGRIMLSGYLEWVAEEGIDANLKIIDVESSLIYPIIEGKAELTGKVDMLAQDQRTGVNSVIDFKTSAQPNSLLKIAAQSPQLQTYVALNMAMDGEKAQGLNSGTYRILRKVKRTAKAAPPFYIEHEVRYSRAQLENHWLHTRSKVQQIVDAREALDAGITHQLVVPPTVSDRCSWKCEFQSICPLFDDGSDVEAAIADQFDVRDPYAYRASDAVLDL